MKGKNLLNTVIVVGIFSSLIFSKSCANTSTPPEGGPKDTIPPVLVEIIPAYNSTGHPTDVRHSSVSFEFDEYVVLNNPNSYIYLSPPQSKPPTAKIKGKKVVVPAFGRLLDGNLGIYKLTGRPELLNFLYLAGAGSRCGEGHGKMEVIL